jgi:hypothetical protein
MGAEAASETNAEVIARIARDAPHHLDVEIASTVRGLAAGKKITTSAPTSRSPRHSAANC